MMNYLPLTEAALLKRNNLYAYSKASVMQCIFNMVQVYHLKKILKKVNLLKN